MGEPDTATPKKWTAASCKDGGRIVCRDKAGCLVRPWVEWKRVEYGMKVEMEPTVFYHAAEGVRAVAEVGP